MGKMKELDQLFRDIGDNFLQEERNRNPNHTYKFLENYQGYTYFWERKLQVDETTENYAQFAILADFKKSYFKCMYKGWDIVNNKQSEPKNEFTDTIGSYDFDTFIRDLISFLISTHGHSEYLLISDISLIKRLIKLVKDK